MVLGWLKPDKIDSHEIHLEKHDLLEDETCDWMTSSDIWKAWIEGGSVSDGGYRRFLWIHGIPGAGKTILASFLIDSTALVCQARGYSYYYCSHQRGQDETRPFLQWVLADLCNQSNRFIPPELHSLHEQHRGNVHGVATDSLLRCLLAVTRRFGRQVYIIVDAVDESVKPRNHFLRVLTTIGTDPDFEHVSLLMTSRDEVDIRAAIRAVPPLGSIPPFLQKGLILTPQVSRFRRPQTPRVARTPQPSPTRNNQHLLGKPYLEHIPDLAPPNRAVIPPPSSGLYTNPLVLAQMSPSKAQQLGARAPTPLPSIRIRKSSAMDADPVEPHTPARQHGHIHAPTPTRAPRHTILLPENSAPNQAYTELSMDNQFVLNAIRTYVHRKLQRIEQLKYLRPAFVEQIEMKLAREARGM